MGVLAVVLVLVVAASAVARIWRPTGPDDPSAQGASPAPTATATGGGARTGTGPTPRGATPSATPAVSALRGSTPDRLPAPELLGTGTPPPGAGFSPEAPADGDAWTIRFPDAYEDQSLDVVVGHLSDATTTAGDHWLGELSDDEVWMGVDLHITPRGYADGDYALRPEVRLEGTSGRWYTGTTVDYQDSTSQRLDTYVFVVPRWDVPSRAVVEVSVHAAYTAVSVYVLAG